MLIRIISVNKKISCSVCGLPIRWGTHVIYQEDQPSHPECFLKDIQDLLLPSHETNLTPEEVEKRKQLQRLFAAHRSRLSKLLIMEQSEDEYEREVAKLRIVRERWWLLGLYRVMGEYGGAPVTWEPVIRKLLEESK